MVVQPNKWSCLPTAFAIASKLPVERIIDYIGHDGSEIIYPDLEEPFCRRAFHLQELVDVMLLHNIAVVSLERDPESYVDEKHRYTLPRDGKIPYFLKRHRGVLIGTTVSGDSHAVAWDKRKIIDPNGMKYNLDMFNIEIFCAVFNITNSE